MPEVADQIRLQLAPHGRLVRDGQAVRVSLPWLELRLGQTGAGLTAALERLATAGATEEECVAEVRRSEGDLGLFGFYGALHPLDCAGALSRALVQDAAPLATLIPQAASFHLPTLQAAHATRYRLSRFACLRAVAGTWQLESGPGRARLEVHDPRVLAWIGDLALNRPEHRDHGLTAASIETLLVFLEAAGALCDRDNTERPQNSMADANAWWEFHDLLFHMRSRRGRSAGPYGATYHFREQPAPPLIHPRRISDSIPLPRPDLNVLAQSDAPFVTVVEKRRSIRDYAPEPISCAELGEFLYRTARITSVLPAGETDCALRPTPAGGALHELEIYAVVAQCQGLEMGLYHYDPHGHALGRLSGMTPEIELLLKQAWHTADKRSPVQVYLGITARCRRVFWKYEGMAYALMLKNLGALYATMYLAATAMSLAPCALGGGDSELFCRAAGIDPLEEPALGEFLLGSLVQS
jgi:SagB-type dehydrogenase family enzyme